MERRDFLSATLGASILASAAGTTTQAQAGAAPPAPAPQGSAAPALPQGKATAPGSANYFVWRQYSLRSGPLPQRGMTSRSQPSENALTLCATTC